MSELPHHAPITQFPLHDDELVVGGVPIRRLAEQVGRTPFYAYDREAITRRVHDLREALPEGLSLHYAMKANPMPAVVDHLASLVDGLDIASAGELAIALDTGTAPADISFAGPGKRDAELHAAAASGITINLESAGELERLARQAEVLGLIPRVAVRVNPDFELKSTGMKMTGGAKPFGIDAEQVPAVMQRIAELGMEFMGLQIFAGSQTLRHEILVDAHRALFELAYQLAEQAPAPLQTLNIGGGFGIPYFPGDLPLELAPVADNLATRLAECRQRLGTLEVVLELGRYLVGEAGVYVTRVVDRKVSRGQTFLVCDGGLNHHLAATGNFGQVIRKNYPVVIGHRVGRGRRELVSVVGPLCTPLDLLADRLEMGHAEVGDLVVVLQSGAYGFSASPHRFLSHPEPMQVLV